ncbi:MAG: hypothetical protein ACTSWP_05555 [Candidatus Freyarchaeota archaeon]
MSSISDILIRKSIKMGLKLGWDEKPGKPDKRMSLLSHTINAMTIADRLMDTYDHYNIYKFDEVERRIILSALFIHDFSKADEDISKQLQEGKVKELPKRLRDNGNIRQDVEKCLETFGLNKSEIERAVDYAISMEYIDPSDINEFLLSKPVDRKAERILRLSDRLASIKTLDEALKPQIIKLVEPLKLTYHRVAVVRGFSTNLLHKAIQKIFEEKEWFPILSVPEGTLYIGKNEFKINVEEILSHLNREFEVFINSFSEEEIGEAAFGSFTATAIKTPEFIFINKKAAESFWRYIASRNVISNPRTNVNKLSKKIREALEAARPGLDENGLKYYFELYNSMRYVLMMGVEVIKTAEKISKALFDEIISNLKKRKVDIDNIMRANPRYNSPFPDVIRIVDEFLKKMEMENLRKEEIIKRTIKLFAESTAKAVEKIKPTITSLKSLLKKLCKEVVYPEITKFNWKDSYDAYLNGKNVGTPLCPLCGSKSEIDGVASLIGDGTQSFNNFLAGGTSIGSRNIVKVCSLCVFEAKLRSLVGRIDNFDVFYVIPQTIIASEFAELFWSMATDKLRLGKLKSEFSSIPNVIAGLTSWANMILNGKAEEAFAKSFDELREETLRNVRNDENIRKAIEQMIENSWDGDFEAFAKELENETGYKVKNIDDLYHLVVEHPELIDYLGEEVKNKLKETRKIAVAPTNNYVILLLERIGKGSDPETIKLLRKIFVSLLISKMFLSSVIISELPLSVLTTVTSKGIVNVPVKLGLKDFLEKYMENGWITYNKYNELMRKLSALILLEKSLVNFGSGAATLYELTKKSPGRILHEIVERAKNKLKGKNERRLRNIVKNALEILKEVEN